MELLDVSNEIFFEYLLRNAGGQQSLGLGVRFWDSERVQKALSLEHLGVDSRQFAIEVEIIHRVFTDGHEGGRVERTASSPSTVLRWFGGFGELLLLLQNLRARL